MIATEAFETIAATNKGLLRIGRSPALETHRPGWPKSCTSYASCTQAGSTNGQEPRVIESPRAARSGRSRLAARVTTSSDRARKRRALPGARRNVTWLPTAPAQSITYGPTPRTRESLVDALLVLVDAWLARSGSEQRTARDPYDMPTHSSKGASMRWYVTSSARLYTRALPTATCRPLSSRTERYSSRPGFVAQIVRRSRSRQLLAE